MLTTEPGSNRRILFGNRVITYPMRVTLDCGIYLSKLIDAVAALVHSDSDMNTTGCGISQTLLLSIRSLPSLEPRTAVTRWIAIRQLKYDKCRKRRVTAIGDFGKAESLRDSGWNSTGILSFHCSSFWFNISTAAATSTSGRSTARTEQRCLYTWLLIMASSHIDLNALNVSCRFVVDRVPMLSSGTSIGNKTSISSSRCASGVPTRRDIL